MKRYLLLLLGIMIAAIAMANDVITKKNGTTIQCKVMKVGRTEVEYKNFTNIDGPVYALDLTEIASITYENGTVDKFGEQSVVTTNAGQRTLSDAELATMYNQLKNPYPGRKMQRTGYVLGGTGLAMMISGWIIGAKPENGDELEHIYVFSGGILIAAGATCYLVGKYQKKKVERFNQTALFQQDFQLGNNTMLSADVNMINDNITHDKSLGLGLRFTF